MSDKGCLSFDKLVDVRKNCIQQAMLWKESKENVDVVIENAKKIEAYVLTEIPVAGKEA